MHRNVIRTFALVCLCGVAGWAQPLTAIIRGSVKDESSAVVPAAEVTITDASGHTTRTESRSDGYFVFRGVAPGTYSVEVTFGGMEQKAAVLVTAAAGRETIANVTLAVRTQKQEVTVNESPGNQVSTEAANNVSALVLHQQDLDALPDDPDDLQADLEALAGPPAGPGGSQIYRGRFHRRPLPPKVIHSRDPHQFKSIFRGVRQAGLRPHRDFHQTGHR